VKEQIQKINSIVLKRNPFEDYKQDLRKNEQCLFSHFSKIKQLSKIDKDHQLN
jgi:hypothetical protein